jgi:hypothetical protein
LLINGVAVVGCWAHLRRKFDEALKIVPEKGREDSPALLGKRYCDRLFSLEREFKHLSSSQRFEKRMESSEPLMEEFFTWLFANTPRGAKASAMIYSVIETAKENRLNPFEYLTHIFTTAPNLDLNNLHHLDTLLPYYFDATAGD